MQPDHDGSWSEPQTPSEAALRGARGTCPRCGQGALFLGVLQVRDRCQVCGLDLSTEDSGDGPAAFLIFFISLVGVGVGLPLVMVLGLGLWLAAGLVTLLVLALTVASLRPSKGLLIGLQYYHDASDTGI